MIRVTLTAPERLAVQALRRDPTLRPAERDRVEMVLLSATGWTVPAIAQHLGYCAATVRTVLKQFTPTDLTSLRRQRPGPPKDLARAEQVMAALNRRLDEPRTWTARQLAHALPEEGIRLSTRQTRKYLKRLGANWRRTTRSLQHKQNPAQVEQAKRKLAHLEKRGPRGDSNSLTSTSVASRPASR
jgi:putative transposase